MVPNVNGTSYATTAAQALTPGHSFTLYVYAMSSNSQTASLATQTFALAALAAPTGLTPSGGVARRQRLRHAHFQLERRRRAGADHYYLVVVDNSVTGTSR